MNRFYKIALTFLASAGICGVSFSQINYGGEPENWNEKNIERIAVQFQDMPAVDLELARAQDAVTDQYKETPYRFGIELEADIDIINDGIREQINGVNIYRYGIECEGATSVNLTFDHFDVPKGDQVFIYTKERNEFLGAYDHRSVKRSESGELESFAVGILHSDAIVIEYIQNSTQRAELHVGQVVHGYRPVLNKWEADQDDIDRGPFGSSGACNINANCPEGDPWDIESKSVALILSGGFAHCSGALVNNTQQDGTPYFLTANHCLNGNEGNWVFYFNHETAGCSGSTGPTNQSISGSTVRASNGGSDFGLLELDDVPPASFDVQYCGWDRSDVLNAPGAVGIHHPSGDVKKICFEEDTPEHDFAAGAAVWWIDEWEDGVTEGGSSGSPLFNMNHHIIGQLYGGLAACNGSTNNGAYDYYGRFAVSWDGNSASTRLRDWLDPLGISPLVLNGWPYGAETFALDATVGPAVNDPGTICGSSYAPVINIVNQGTSTLTSATIQYILDGQSFSPIQWTGELDQYESDQIQLPALILSDGVNNLTVTVTSANGSDDDNEINNSFTQQINALAGPTTTYSLDLILDDWGSETTWSLTLNNNTLYSGGPYDNGEDQTLIQEDFCLSNGCYEFTIFDDYGDGICCEYGQGSYSIEDAIGTEVGSGGEFTDDDTVEFCVDVEVGIEDEKKNSFKMYPNPARGSFIIEFSQVESNANIEILDNTGRLIMSSSVQNTDRTNINISGLASGTYFVRMSTTNFAKTQSLIVK